MIYKILFNINPRNLVNLVYFTVICSRTSCSLSCQTHTEWNTKKAASIIWKRLFTRSGYSTGKINPSK